MDDHALELLLQRYAQGNRDPELLRDLDALAWQAFHDPWEQPHQSSEPRSACALEQAENTLSSLPADIRSRLSPTQDDAPDWFPDFLEEIEREPPILEDPKAVQNLSLGLIEGFLRTWDLHAYRQDQAFYIPFDYSLNSDREMQMLIAVSGPHHSQLEVAFESDTRISRERFPEALAFCNRYNHERNGLKAALVIPKNQEGQPAASGKLRAWMHLDLLMGIHADLLNALLAEALGDAWIFWRLAQEEGL